ncbi:hypothetical protein EC32303_A0017 [Escherichia coli 3.2303]|nr:hypothetical protein EC32303_A0017 [Escherichia coli 3.2303]
MFLLTYTYEARKPGVKDKLPKWHSTEPVSGIPQGRSKSVLTPSFGH